MADKKQGSCTHERIWLQLCTDSGEEIEHRELTRQELESRAVELPDREAMSLVNANIAAPINLALAANVLSDGSVANATAQQITPITQGI